MVLPAPLPVFRSMKTAPSPSARLPNSGTFRMPDCKHRSAAPKRTSGWGGISGDEGVTVNAFAETARGNRPTGTIVDGAVGFDWTGAETHP
eukprot:5719165-Pyramimonas_sp.AAC.1